MKKQSDQHPQGRLAREFLGIEVSTICDQNCIYCFALAGRKKEHLSYELAAQFSHEGRKAGYRGLHITGGEPLLWPHLFKLIEYAVEIGYETVYINTGARQVTKELAAEFARYRGHIRCSVTINGPKAVHEKTRGMGTYDRAVSGMKALMEQGIPVELFTVVSRMLMKDLSDFISGVVENWPGLERHTLIQMHRTEQDDALLKEMIINEEEFIELVRIVALYSTLGFRVRIMENPLSSVVAQKLGFGQLPSASILRPFKMILMIDGAITGAHSHRAEKAFYEPGKLLELVEQERLFRQEPHERCLGCEYFQECQSAGMSFPSEKSRDYNVQEPFCVRVLEALTLYQQSQA